MEAIQDKALKSGASPEVNLRREEVLERLNRIVTIGEEDSLQDPHDLLIFQNTRRRFTDEIAREKNPDRQTHSARVEELCIAVLTPTGRLESYFIAPGGKAKEVIEVLHEDDTTFSSLSTHSLFDCAGIGITIPGEMGIFKMLLHSQIVPSQARLLLAVGIKRAIELGADPQKINAVVFTSLTQDIYRNEVYVSTIQELLDEIGLHAWIVFKKSPKKRDPAGTLIGGKIAI